MKLYRLFIPKKYNNGKEIESEKILTITKGIEKKFGSYSINPHATLPIIQGKWLDQASKKTYEDELFCVELFVEDTFDNCNWLKSFTEIARQELNQKELFVLCQNAELIKFEK